MILLLDNYDSFVHNLARYFRLAGCETIVIRSDDIDAAGCIAMNPQGIVISPGPKRPEEAGCSIEVVRQVPTTIPLLGVCLGHQAIGVAFGGCVTACEPMHGMASPITHARCGLFEGCPSPMMVGRYHSLAIQSQTLPDSLVATAYGDGEMIMAVQHRERPIFGVQFHPESVLTPEGQQVVDNFVRLAHSPHRVDDTRSDSPSCL